MHQDVLMAREHGLVTYMTEVATKSVVVLADIINCDTFAWLDGTHPNEYQHEYEGLLLVVLPDRMHADSLCANVARSSMVI